MSRRRALQIALVALTLHALACVSAVAGETVSQTFVANGIKLHYLIAGEGEPVLLLHGLYANAETNWVINGVVRDLAKDHKVIALDLPGHGESEASDKEAGNGMAVIDDIVLLLDDLKIKKAHVVGYSLGGMITMKFMATHPDRVISGTMGGMGWFREGSPMQKIWEKMPGMPGGRPPAAFLHTVGQFAVSEAEIKKIALPVKLIVGGDDMLKISTVEPLEQIRKDWPVVEIPGAGHITCIFKAQFRDEVVAWVKKNSK